MRAKSLPARPASVAPTNDLTALWRRYQHQPMAAEAIYATLREAILRGILPAGERLGEIQLAGLFERSRTPVREAILRLESEHLAERSARRGFVVAGITREEVLEVYAVREMLDGLAARLAAQGILSPELGHLTWLNARMRKAAEQQDYQLMLDLNIEFHEKIGSASRNTRLLNFMRQIHDWVRRFPSTTFSHPGRTMEAVDEHDEIIEALSKRDSEAAERLARRHMARAMQVRIAMLQNPDHES